MILFTNLVSIARLTSFEGENVMMHSHQSNTLLGLLPVRGWVMVSELSVVMVADVADGGCRIGS